jgi:hypothetical protein
MTNLSRDQLLNIVVTGLMLFLAASFVIGAFTYAPRMRIVPLVIGIPTIAMLVFILALELRPDLFKPRKLREAEEAPKPEAPRQVSASGIDAGRWQRVVTIYGWIVGFFAATLVLGHYLAIPLFLLAFFIKETKVDPVRAIAVSAAVTVVLIVVFDLLLDIPLWPGVLPRIIPHYIGGGSMPPLYRGL